MSNHSYVIVIKVKRGVSERPDWGFNDNDVTRNISNNGIHCLDRPVEEATLVPNLLSSIKPMTVIIYEDNPITKKQNIRSSFQECKIPLRFFIHFGGTNICDFDSEKIITKFSSWSNLNPIPKHIKAFPFVGYDLKDQGKEWIPQIYEFRDWQKDWNGIDGQQFIDNFKALDIAWEHASKHFDTGLAMKTVFELLSPLALDAVNGIEIGNSYNQIRTEVEKQIEIAKLPTITDINNAAAFMEWFKVNLSIVNTEEFGFSFRNIKPAGKQ